jgi:hypothetical protein
MRCTMRIGLHTPNIFLWSRDDDTSVAEKSVQGCGSEHHCHTGNLSGCLINAVGLPLARTPNYLGPWMARRMQVRASLNVASSWGPKSGEM